MANIDLIAIMWLTGTVLAYITMMILYMKKLR